MTSLGYCNVMNYFNGSYTVISYSYGFMEFLSFFQSDITSHIPLGDVTNPSRALYLPLPSVLPKSISHLSGVQRAGHVHAKLDGPRRQRPLEFIWTPSSKSTLIKKAVNSQIIRVPSNVHRQMMT